MKILIIQQKMIGDVLATSILFEVIKNNIPNSELHYIINQNTFPVVDNNPFIDKYHIISPEIEKSKLKFYYFLKSIRKEKYDTIIDVYSKFSSSLITFFSNAEIKISKYKWYSSFIYSQTFKEQITKKTEAGLAIENRLQLLKPLNIKIDKTYKPKIYLTQEKIDHAKLFLKSNGINFSKPIFMIGILGSSIEKTFPFKKMLKVIDTIIAETDGQLLFNYIPNQFSQANEIYNLCSSENKKNIFFDIYSKNLLDFLAITKHCQAVIGNEGGAINMAKALDIPTFTIFSPWIEKDAWNMFDNGKSNVSVHLKDFKPEIFENKEIKKLKKEAQQLYKKFDYEFFVDILKTFLKQF